MLKHVDHPQCWTLAIYQPMKFNLMFQIVKTITLLLNFVETGCNFVFHSWIPVFNMGIYAFCIGLLNKELLGSFSLG